MNGLNTPIPTNKRQLAAIAQSRGRVLKHFAQGGFRGLLLLMVVMFAVAGAASTAYSQKKASPLVRAYALIEEGRFLE